mgnify:CR=1 FL=1
MHGATGSVHAGGSQITQAFRSRESSLHSHTVEGLLQSLRSVVVAWLQCRVYRERVVKGAVHVRRWCTPVSSVWLQGRLYREKAAGKEGEGGVGLVLGAGNQLPVATLDILHKLVRLGTCWVIARPCHVTGAIAKRAHGECWRRFVCRGSSHHFRAPEH